MNFTRVLSSVVAGILRASILSSVELPCYQTVSCWEHITVFLHPFLETVSKSDSCLILSFFFQLQNAVVH
jgi:hypothetical protein